MAPIGYLGEAYVAAHLGRADVARALMAKVRQLAPEMALADWQRIMRRGLAGNAVGDEVGEQLGRLWGEAEGGRSR